MTENEADKYRVEQAKKLLRESGYAEQADGTWILPKDSAPAQGEESAPSP